MPSAQFGCLSHLSEMGEFACTVLSHQLLASQFTCGVSWSRVQLHAAAFSAAPPWFVQSAKGAAVVEVEVEISSSPYHVAESVLSGWLVGPPHQVLMWAASVDEVSVLVVVVVVELVHLVCADIKMSHQLSPLHVSEPHTQPPTFCVRPSVSAQILLLLHLSSSSCEYIVVSQNWVSAAQIGPAVPLS
jgi:hypothetical protein